MLDFREIDSLTAHRNSCILNRSRSLNSTRHPCCRRDSTTSILSPRYVVLESVLFSSLRKSLSRLLTGGLVIFGSMYGSSEKILCKNTLVMQTCLDGVIICTHTLKTSEASSPMLMDLRPEKSMTKLEQSIKSLGGCTVVERRIFSPSRSLQASEMILWSFPVIFSPSELNALVSR